MADTSPTYATSRAAQIHHPLVSGNPPPWATAWGQDEYGIFAEFTVIADDGKEVDQRMRWIPPGKFMMGSPEDRRLGERERPHTK